MKLQLQSKYFWINFGVIEFFINFVYTGVVRATQRLCLVSNSILGLTGFPPLLMAHDLTVKISGSTNSV